MRIFFLAAGLTFFTIFLYFFVTALSYKPSAPSEVAHPTPTNIPVSNPSFHVPAVTIDPNQEYDSYPSFSPLSAEERAFPTGIPQQFTRKAPLGTLVITSDLGSVSIFIDEAFSPEGTGPVSPENITPFVTTIPAGVYEITAKKSGYVDGGFSVTVQPGLVSRLQVNLDPLVVN